MAPAAVTPRSGLAVVANRTVAVTGAGGQLGIDLVAALMLAGYEAVGFTHAELDVTDRPAVLAAVADSGASAIVHAAAWTDVDGCELDPARALRVNAWGTRNVADAARRNGAHVVYVSSDYVFDGESERPYHEWDVPNPLSAYGASKLAGERELGPDATVVRTSWVCGAHGRNFVRSILGALDTREHLDVVMDQRGAVTFTADLAVALAWLVGERVPGIFHVRNAGELTWWDFAREIARAAGTDPDRVRPITTAQLVPPRAAPRPRNSVLDGVAWRCAGGPQLPPWTDSLPGLVAQLSVT